MNLLRWLFRGMRPRPRSSEPPASTNVVGAGMQAAGPNAFYSPPEDDHDPYFRALGAGSEPLVEPSVGAGLDAFLSFLSPPGAASEPEVMLARQDWEADLDPNYSIPRVVEPEPVHRSSRVGEALDWDRAKREQAGENWRIDREVRREKMKAGGVSRVMVRVVGWLDDRLRAGDPKALNVGASTVNKGGGEFLVILFGGGKRRQAMLHRDMGDNEFGSVMAGILEGLRPPLEGSYLRDDQIDRGMPENTPNLLAGDPEET